MPATTDRAAPNYPIPHPACGDDPRFCFGLAYDIAQVLATYGYPPIATGADLLRLQQALFGFIYQEKDHTP
jgi:hypothetical protein